MELNILSIILCIVLFILYIYIDYHKYDYMKIAEGFNMNGHPNSSENAPLPYTYLAKAIKNPSNLKTDDENKEMFVKLVTGDNLNRINSRELDEYYNLNVIEEDFMYFNNASIIMEQHYNNDLGYIKKHFDSIKEEE